MKALIAACAATLALVPTALATTAHGFRDPRAPQEAAAILNTLPSVDGMRCHWKVTGHTIGCVGLVTGATAQMYLWSDGSHVLYRACTGGACTAATRAHHVFGRPY